MTTTKTVLWVVNLWCDACHEAVGHVHSVALTPGPDTYTLADVRDAMRKHEREKHEG
jgi:hypothetical protein